MAEKTALEASAKADAAAGIAPQANSAPAPSAPVAGTSTPRGTATPRDGTPATEMDLDELKEPSSVANGRHEDVGSDVDELASTNGSIADSVAETSFSSAAGSRQAVLREKSLQKKAEAAAKAKSSLASKSDSKKKAQERKGTPQAAVPDKQRIEEGLVSVQARDEQTEREFRRHQQVLRVRPLGKDRFFNRYWYFDGIGTMELLSEEGKPVYGTGRLFVQGPSAEDWMAAYETEGGEDGLKQRRAKEVVNEQAILDVGEWSYLTTDEEASRSFVCSDT